MGGKAVSYTILVADKPKNSEEEWDVMEFSSLVALKKYRRSHPEKMSFSYGYALSRGVDKQFCHINVAEADHFKQFVRLIGVSLDIENYCTIRTSPACQSRYLWFLSALQ
ncbi:hypothetical protein [Raoultella sp. HC6]|uniref:hypothetical protein n=1 Tax=Raoultella sp. HC6 TaxID=2923366 RepID=UPI001F514B1E|nr:hypothetical protein [Raoultella sp. HC6]